MRWRAACCARNWLTQQRALVQQVLARPGATNADAKVKRLAERDDAALRFTLSMLNELAAQKTLDYPIRPVAGAAPARSWPLRS